MMSPPIRPDTVYGPSVYVRDKKYNIFNNYMGMCKVTTQIYARHPKQDKMNL